MKKIAIICALIFCLFLLAGCKPADMSSETYDMGKSTVAIANEYLRADLTTDEAVSKLQTICDRLNSLEALDGAPVAAQTLALSSDVSTIESNIKLDDLSTVKAIRDRVSKRLNAGISFIIGLAGAIVGFGGCAAVLLLYKNHMKKKTVHKIVKPIT